MKPRRARKKRRIETYADPRVFRDVLPLIVMHCTMQTFSRLKRVCKDFLRWLPKEHPALALIRSGYVQWPSVCYPEKVALLFDEYYRRFVNDLPQELRKFVVISSDFHILSSEMLHVNKHTGIIHNRTCIATHIFSKSYMKAVRPERFCNLTWNMIHNMDYQGILGAHCDRNKDIGHVL
jgi:hypothetical protein